MLNKFFKEENVVWHLAVTSQIEKWYSRRFSIPADYYYLKKELLQLTTPSLHAFCSISLCFSTPPAVLHSVLDWISCRRILLLRHDTPVSVRKAGAAGRGATVLKNWATAAAMHSGRRRSRWRPQLARLTRCPPVAAEPHLRHGSRRMTVACGWAHRL